MELVEQGKDISETIYNLHEAIDIFIESGIENDS
jgi:predicted RNase H-like HicB family nuclease